MTVVPATDQVSGTLPVMVTAPLPFSAGRGGGAAVPDIVGRSTEVGKLCYWRNQATSLQKYTEYWFCALASVNSNWFSFHLLKGLLRWDQAYGLFTVSLGVSWW